MKHTLRRPCNDCPFRREAAPGWLGANSPAWFVESALADEAEYGASGANFAPCHQTVDYEQDDWLDTLDEVEVCVGALQFAANCGKLPRNTQRANAVLDAGKSEDVFSSSHEFFEHHTLVGVDD